MSEIYWKGKNAKCTGGQALSEVNGGEQKVRLEGFNKSVWAGLGPQ